MKLSKQSRELIEQIGSSIGRMFSEWLSPLQILILVELRHREGKLQKGEHVYTDHVRISINRILKDGGGGFNPTRQAFWKAFESLQKEGFAFVAPPKKTTWKRAIYLTQKGADLFSYPKSIHPYNTTS